MAARIFQRSKNALQSVKAFAETLLLEFESRARTGPDPLMGWSGGADTQSQVSIAFDSLEAAKAYAERSGIAYHVIPPTPRRLRIQSYADNFK